jgi:hypothetical protein
VKRSAFFLLCFAGLILALVLLRTEPALAAGQHFQAASPTTAVASVTTSANPRGTIAAVIAFAVVVGLMMSTRLLKKPKDSPSTDDESKR